MVCTEAFEEKDPSEVLGCESDSDAIALNLRLVEDEDGVLDWSE